MRCPGCGLYHPSQYENCVSCGMSMKNASDSDVAVEEAVAPVGEAASSHSNGGNDSKRRSSHLKHQSKAGIPTTAGVMTGLAILLVTAGATFFFFTRTPDDERLLQTGREQLGRNQYAFAVETLSKAAQLKPDDPRVHLLLARAYVGISDVDKAWASISKAQQLGKGVVAEPDLASDLANYYMKRQQYDKAIDLLRPLAKENIGDKKSELADLDAAYGDTLISKGNLEAALRCWEEVRDLKAGSRTGEAEARLATIYEKLATKSAGENKDTAAIDYLSKLTNIAHNPKHYLSMSDIYERNGKLDLAIEQLRKANELSSSPDLQKRLAQLLSKRGKELLDEGQNDVGYAYLQQAKSMDSNNAVPVLTLRNIDVGLDPFNHMPRIQGEVWNPGDSDVGKLTLRAELWDTKSDHSIWSKEQRMVDDFVKPLGGHESRQFNFTSGTPTKVDGTIEFRMYLNNNLYKAYTLKKKGSGSNLDTDIGSSSSPQPTAKTPEPAPPIKAAPPVVSGDVNGIPTAPPPGTTAGAPVAPAPGTTPGGTSPEEKTLKDLDF